MDDLVEVLGAQPNVLVVGARGAIGGAFCDVLNAALPEARLAKVHRGDGNGFEATLEPSVETKAAELKGTFGSFRLIINCLGILHDAEGLQPEKTWRQITSQKLERYFQINAIAPALLIKHLCPLLDRTAASAFVSLSARVGSIGDNQLGGWYGYRASKAAHNMLIKTAAIELKRTHPQAFCIAMHPGTVSSKLSEPYLGVRPAQTPREAAASMLSAIAQCDASSSGGFFAYDGSRIPF